MGRDLWIMWQQRGEVKTTNLNKTPGDRISDKTKGNCKQIQRWDHSQ